MRSSFNGIIDEIPDIAVDNFLSLDRQAYFLSHCHTDHTEGLYSQAFVDYLERENIFIYMSKPSSIIVCNESVEKNLPALGNYIKPLAIDTKPITIPARQRDGREEQYISVLLIPASHCLGSVMFLFKTLYKTVLYTGDFRISENSVCKYSQLHEKGEKIKIDALYVDTTFLSDSHMYFPKRSDSVELIIRHIAKWLKLKTTNRVALHTSARYGYEFVFNDLYKRLNEKVYVDEEMWKLYSQIPNTVKGVTNDAQITRIHRCRNRTENFNHNKCYSNYKCHPNDNDYLFIHFSALKWTDQQIDDTMINLHSKKNRIDVCFATHCSKSELEYFVNYLAPKKVVGFRNCYTLKDPNIITTKKRNAPRSSEKLKQETKVAKVDKATVRKIFSD